MKILCMHTRYSVYETFFHDSSQLRRVRLRPFTRETCETVHRKGHD